DFVNWNPSDWVYKKFLTNYPRDEHRLIFPGDRYYVSFFYTQQPGENPMRLRRRIETDAGGSATSAIVPTNIINYPTVKPMKIGVCNLLSGDWSGVQLINYDIMTFSLWDNAESEQIGELLELRISDPTCSHGGTVHFMNKLGVME